MKGKTYISVNQQKGLYVSVVYSK